MEIRRKTAPSFEILGKYYPIEIDEKMPAAQVLLSDVRCALSSVLSELEQGPLMRRRSLCRSFGEMSEMCDFDLSLGLGGDAEIQYLEGSSGVAQTCLPMRDRCQLCTNGMVKCMSSS